MTTCRKAVICRGALGQQHLMATELLSCVLLEGLASRGAAPAGTGRKRRGKSRDKGPGGWGEREVLRPLLPKLHISPDS